MASFRQAVVFTSNTIKSTIRSNIVRQSTGYIAAVIASNLMALLTTSVLTRILSVDDYSEYVFGLNLLMFLSIFFELGLFYPAAQLIAKATEPEARKLTGAAMILWLGASVLFSVTVLLLTFGPLQAIFQIHTANELGIVAPLAGAWLATQVALLFAQGHGRLQIFSTTSVVTSGLLLVSVLVALAAGVHPGPTLMLLLYGASLLVGSVACFAWFRPTFSQWTLSARRILTQTRVWGLNLFVGRVLSMGTYRLDVIMLGALSGSTPVASYVLATALTTPVGLPGLSSATALFKRMTGLTQIDRRWILGPLIVSLGATAALGLAGTPIVDLLFSSKYGTVPPLLVPLALAAMLQGTTAMYNRFLAAHERGKELRTTAFWLAGANVIFNVALIPPFAALGAAWASVAALVVNLIAHVLPYRKIVHEFRVADMALGPANVGIASCHKARG